MYSSLLSQTTTKISTKTVPKLTSMVGFTLLSLAVFPGRASAVEFQTSACSSPSNTFSVGDASPAANFLTTVPAYNWYNGCGPTAAASVLGYWDSFGFSNLFDAGGEDLYLTANVQDEISSPEHNAKYNPTPDDPTLPEPAFNSIADWFQTSVDPLNFGWSYLSFADDAFTGYAGSKGYQFEAFNQRFSNQPSEESFGWNDLMSEIDASRPLMFLVDTDSNGGTDHFVPVLGYDDRGDEGQYYGLYTTWSEEESVLWKPFQELGNPWGVGYATFVRPLDDISPDPTTPKPVSTPEPGSLIGLAIISIVGMLQYFRREGQAS